MRKYPQCKQAWEENPVKPSMEPSALHAAQSWQTNPFQSDSEMATFLCMPFASGRQAHITTTKLQRTLHAKRVEIFFFSESCHHQRKSSDIQWNQTSFKDSEIARQVRVVGWPSRKGVLLVWAQLSAENTWKCPAEEEHQNQHKVTRPLHAILAGHLACCMKLT